VKRKLALHVGYANTIVADAYRRDPAATRRRIRNYWLGKIEPRVDQMLAEYVAQAAGKNDFVIPQQGTPLVLLWIRYSGKKLGRNPAHPELDSSVTALWELANRLKVLKIPYAFVGDQLFSRNRGPEKHADFAQSPFSEGLDLTEFWKSPPFRHDDDGQSRINQLHLIDFLARKFRVVSVGMRSGVLEGPAYLGVPTVYIEDAANPQRERWEKMLGRVPRFYRMQVSQLLTATGVRFRTVEALYALLRTSPTLLRYNKFPTVLSRPDAITEFEGWFFEHVEHYQDAPFEFFSRAYLFLLQDVLRQWYLFAADGTRLIRPAADAAQMLPAGPSPAPLSLASASATSTATSSSSAGTSAGLPPQLVRAPAFAGGAVVLSDTSPAPDFATTIDAWSGVPGLGVKVETLVGRWFMLLVDRPTKRQYRGFLQDELLLLSGLIQATLQQTVAGDHVPGPPRAARSSSQAAGSASSTVSALTQAFLPTATATATASATATATASATATPSPSAAPAAAEGWCIRCRVQRSRFSNGLCLACDRL
jgi:hypothetical protein